ncbi:MAG: hypothetical protein ACTSUE_03710, partial [Promethearchaeota archaeon]
MIESLSYTQNSALQHTSIILQPEMKHDPTFFKAEIVNPAMMIEIFYRLHRVAKVKSGRQALSESQVWSSGRSRSRSRSLWYAYDPIIQVLDDSIVFENFSGDMTLYSYVELFPSAFKNIESWETGYTNVDFND